MHADSTCHFNSETGCSRWSRGGEEEEEGRNLDNFFKDLEKCCLTALAGGDIPGAQGPENRPPSLFFFLLPRSQEMEQ